MRSIPTTLLLALLLASPRVQALSGCGAGGYCYVDCNDAAANAPACPQLDGASSDGSTGLCSDEIYNPPGAQLPFGFPFYGTTYTDLWISANGGLSFGGAAGGPTNQALTGFEGLPFIAPLWDDWAMDNADSWGFFCTRTPSCSNSGPVTFVESYQTGSGNDGTQYFEVEWFSTEQHQLCNGQTADFAVRLYADGRILMKYYDTLLGNAAYDNAASGTIGISHGQAGEFTEFSYNTASIPQNPYSILFFPQTCTDADGDGDCSIGSGGTDCDDNDPLNFPANTEVCDGQDNNCNTLIDEGLDTDADADGHFTLTSCSAPADDCDDADPLNFPGNIELCDGRDNDCNSLDDAGNPGVAGWETDNDGDGRVECDGDCDDTNGANFGASLAYPSAAPANPEICDGQDNDCNGLDDFGSPGVGGQEVDGDADGALACADCDDADPLNFPGNVEICDKRDNDCDGVIDNGLATTSWFPDLDGDGHGGPSPRPVGDSVMDHSASQGGGGWSYGSYFAYDTLGFTPLPNWTGTQWQGIESFATPYLDANGGHPGVDSLVWAVRRWTSTWAGTLDITGAFMDRDTGCGDGAHVRIFQNDVQVLEFLNIPALSTPYALTLTVDLGDTIDFVIDPKFTSACDATTFSATLLLTPPYATCALGPAGYVSLGDDCDDAAPNNFPGNTESCDGLDNDCNGLADADLAGEVDADGDGVLSCLDCDDADPNNFPGNIEMCDGFDNNCNGFADADPAGEVDADGDGVLSCLDCNDSNPSIYPGNLELCDGLDNDCNGLADFPGETTDDDSDGAFACADCDDFDAANFPGNPEICDGQDNDCNFVADFPGETIDNDGDGAIACLDCDDTNSAMFPGNVEVCDGLDNDCSGAPNFPGETTDADADGVINCLDCNDSNPLMFPGNSEVCDGFDNDCNGLVDDGLNTDADGDGHYAPGSCANPADDCNDSNPAIFPGNPEICDGLDNDCNGLIDDTLSTDADGDGHYAMGSCAGPADDCNDSAATVFPGALELCNGIDDNCDGTTDEGFDLDLDGYTTCAGDCNDANATMFPGNTEICDGLDNDCNGLTDEGLSNDIDNDGHYAIGSCAGPADDCDDTDPSVHPGALEIPYDGIDQDCDGVDPSDLDGDGFPGGAGGTDCFDFNAAVNPNGVEGPACDGVDDNCDGQVDEGLACTDDDGDGFSELQGDCDDSNASSAPGLPELPDSLDNNCNGVVDEGTEAYDDDGDGFCEGFDLDNDGLPDCSNGSQPGDCNDGDANISPLATEICNAIDDDCDGLIDRGLSCWDDDGDGFTEDGGDCDDSDAEIHPGVPELPDGLDNDCDGVVDEGTEAYDDDGDGFCEGIDLDNDGLPDCSDGSQPGDCNDGIAVIHPATFEVYGDGFDNNCDGLADNGITDNDGDGWDNATDCDDTDPLSWPGASELADGLDNDCDGVIDEGTLLADDDNDGFCEGLDLDNDGQLDCTDGSLPGDCNDANPATGPTVPEQADGQDNDCDGVVDEGTIYSDDDGDGYTEFTGDCDDADPDINPGEIDLPADEIDQDCNGSDALEALGEDLDNDGYSPLDGDCDDTNPDINPGAEEDCDNAIDDDCDDFVDPDFLCLVTGNSIGGGCNCQQEIFPRSATPWAFLLLLLALMALSRREHSERFP